MSDSDPAIRAQAAWTLGTLNADPAITVPRLIAAAGDADTDVRTGADRAVPILLRALRANSTGVRDEAAWCLGRTGMGTPEVLQALETLLKDPDADVRESAALALRELRGRRKRKS